MNRNDLLMQIKEALQREKALDEKTNIHDLEEWDSLAVLSLISLYDLLFSIQLNISQLNSATTVKDLIDFAKDKLE